MLSDAAISCGPDQAPGPTQSSRAVRPSPCHRRDLRGYLWPLSYTNQTGGQPAGTCFGSPLLSGQPFPFTYPSPPRLGANPGRQPQACGTRTRRCLRAAGHFTPMWGPPTCHFSHGPGFRSLQTLSSVQPELHFYSPGLPRFVSALPTLHRHSALPALSKYYCVIPRRRSPYCALAYAYPLAGLPIYLVWWREIPKPLTYQAQYFIELPNTFLRNATAQYHSDQQPVMAAVRRLSYPSTLQV